MIWALKSEQEKRIEVEGSANTLLGWGRACFPRWMVTWLPGPPSLLKPLSLRGINLVGLRLACLVRGLTVGEEGDWGAGESFRLRLKRKQISKPRAYER